MNDGGPAANTLAGLTDTNIVSPAANDTLVYQSSKWTSVLPGAGIFAHATDGSGGAVTINGGTYTPAATVSGGTAGTLSITATDPADISLTTLQTGAWYGPMLSGGSVQTTTIAASTIYAVPKYLPAGTVIKKYAIHLTSSGNSAFNAEFGVYADNGNFAPGALVSGSDSGSEAVAASSNGDLPYTLTATFTIANAGWYWLADEMSASNTTSGAVMSAMSSGNCPWQVAQMIGGASPAQALSSPVCGYAMSQAFGALPSTFSVSPTKVAASIPIFAFGT